MARGTRLEDELAAANARAAQLEARVGVLEEALRAARDRLVDVLDTERSRKPPPRRPPGSAPSGRLDEALAKLRAGVATTASTSGVGDVPKPEREAPPPPVVEPKPPESDATAKRAARDEVLAPAVEELVREAKHILQDEQNELLDSLRQVRGSLDPDRVLPDVEHQHTAWGEVVEPLAADVYRAGRHTVSRQAREAALPGRLLAELVGTLVLPLRDRLASSIVEAAREGEHEDPAETRRELAGTIGARYREWRTRDLDGAVGDVLAAAFARGAFDAAPTGARLRWVPAEDHQCPDADDNALEPTVKGDAFPTGQRCPPAHPGCRCFLVLVED